MRIENGFWVNEEGVGIFPVISGSPENSTRFFSREELEVLHGMGVDGAYRSLFGWRDDDDALFFFVDPNNQQLGVDPEKERRLQEWVDYAFELNPRWVWHWLLSEDKNHYLLTWEGFRALAEMLGRVMRGRPCIVDMEEVFEDKGLLEPRLLYLRRHFPNFFRALHMRTDGSYPWRPFVGSGLVQVVSLQMFQGGLVELAEQERRRFAGAGEFPVIVAAERMPWNDGFEAGDEGAAIEWGGASPEVGHVELYSTKDQVSSGVEAVALQRSLEGVYWALQHPRPEHVRVPRALWWVSSGPVGEFGRPVLDRGGFVVEASAGDIGWFELRRGLILDVRRYVVRAVVELLEGEWMDVRLRVWDDGGWGRRSMLQATRRIEDVGARVPVELEFEVMLGEGGAPAEVFAAVDVLASGGVGRLRFREFLVE